MNVASTPVAHYAAIRMPRECRVLLEQLRDVWPRVIAAQQSNLCREAMGMVSLADLSVYEITRFRLPSHSTTERDRFAELARACQYLSERQIGYLHDEALYVASEG